MIPTKIETSRPERPIALSLADGIFRDGNRVLKADGKDQKVPATGYWDTVSVRIVDDHTVEVTSKEAGKPMFTETDTVSPDGDTLTQVVKDTTETEAVTFESVFRRITLAPPVHTFSQALVANLQTEPIGEQHDHHIQVHIARIQCCDSAGRKV